jgi:hypothetical protein
MHQEGPCTTQAKNLFALHTVPVNLAAIEPTTDDRDCGMMKKVVRTAYLSRQSAPAMPTVVDAVAAPGFPGRLDVGRSAAAGKRPFQCP